MPSLDLSIVFAGAAVLFAVVPGPAVVYVVTRSVSQGRAAGVVSALGIETGNVIHVAAATLGLSALLASSAIAFMAVKYLGAAYLVYLGVRRLVERGEVEAAEPDRPRRLRRLSGHGVAVAVFNPKTALFFLAFLPQFVDPSRGSVALQFGLLGVLLVVITTVSDTCWALLAGTASRWLRGNVRVVRRQQTVTGGIYIGLGVSAALSGQPSTRA